MHAYSIAFVIFWFLQTPDCKSANVCEERYERMSWLFLQKKSLVFLKPWILLLRLPFLWSETCFAWFH
jgi:hypothetical protein